jgi:hypothetical protein
MQNMVDNSMGHLMQNHSSNENLLLHNEIMQINHLSQLFVGLNVFSVLFFQLSGLLNRDRV